MLDELSESLQVKGYEWISRELNQLFLGDFDVGGADAGAAVDHRVPDCIDGSFEDGERGNETFGQPVHLKTTSEILLANLQQAHPIEFDDALHLAEGFEEHVVHLLLPARDPGARGNVNQTVGQLAQLPHGRVGLLGNDVRHIGESE